MSTIVRVLLGPEVAKIMRVFAGDVVPKKKPDPAIYKLAAQELGVDPPRQVTPFVHAVAPLPALASRCWLCMTQSIIRCRCVVVEDSRIGVLAARAAGMRYAESAVERLRKCLTPKCKYRRNKPSCVRLLA